jgi:hypothetical protein
MGFNTNITICNDNLADYERQPERFMSVVTEGLQSGAKSWGITVQPTDHADATQLIAVGHNSSTKVFTANYLASHHLEAGQVELLRRWADALGYRISKK